MGSAVQRRSGESVQHGSWPSPASWTPRSIPLVENVAENVADEVVVNPMNHGTDGLSWPIKGAPAMSVMRRRFIEPPPRQSLEDARPRGAAGHGSSCCSAPRFCCWARRRLRIETNQVAEFPPLMPHAFGAEGGPCEVMFVFDRDARRGHRDTNGDSDGQGIAP